VISVQGPPQGVEILEFQDEGLKLATQLLPPELILARAPFVGESLVGALQRADYFSSWTASVRSRAEGEVRPNFFKRPVIRFEPLPSDLEQVRAGVGKLAELLLELGAQRVFPGILGGPMEMSTPRDLEALSRAPLDPRSYFLGVGHLFGTCRLGSDATASVVDSRFRVHGKRGLYVVDASVFPSAPGVNPILSILALAKAASHRILQEGSPS
jgi:choline dehydrogenase-like flavoprotein